MLGRMNIKAHSLRTRLHTFINHISAFNAFKMPKDLRYLGNLPWLLNGKCYLEHWVFWKPPQNYLTFNTLAAPNKGRTEFPTRRYSSVPVFSIIAFSFEMKEFEDFLVWQLWKTTYHYQLINLQELWAFSITDTKSTPLFSSSLFLPWHLRNLATKERRNLMQNKDGSILIYF